MPPSERLVLGAGLNGLIFGFYNPDFDIVDFGRESNIEEGSPMDSLVVLHWTPENAKLMKDLDIPYQVKHKPIYYFYNDKLYDTLPEPLLTEYVVKKLGGRKELIGKDRTLSVPGQMYSYINVPVSEVLGALKNKVSVWWNAELLGITDKTVELVDYSLPYELLVSTLPAPVFWENYKVDKYRPAKLELEAVPATYALRAQAPPEIEQELEFAFIYFADNRTYHRVGHVHEGYAYEYSNGQDENIGEIFRIKEAVLKTCPHNIPPPRTLFCGRHAVWKHWWKVQHTVKMATQRFDWELMWYRQALFETHFLDYNREHDELTEDTIYYMTCLQSELHEMLRELEWKKWKPGTKVDRIKVLAEYIDALKFMITLGNVWGFTPEEVLDEFYRKTEEVETNFKSKVDAP